ncbi:MAG: TrkH family potassium uptake protein [Weeksellaceae bacterium]
MKTNNFRRFLKWYQRLQISKSPQINLVWGFFLYVIIGFVLLSLPIMHKTDVRFIDSLFISTSAVSTTGLVTISIADTFNIGGQFIVMMLIQLGGIGYMTLTTYFLLLTTRRLTRWHSRIIGAEFTMPESIKINDFIRSVIIFTFVMEALGALCLFIAFYADGMELFQSIWFGIFHSISAFCTAGFGLFNDSFEGYQDHVFINIVLSVLAIAGSLGFIVITDLWYKFSGKSKSISFTSKIIIYGFIALLSVGTLLTYFTEPVMSQTGNHPLMKSFFQSMSAMTTVGFNSVTTGDISLPNLLLVIFLMYVGASPSGTAGGMKITTLTAMISVIKSRLLGEEKITFMNRRIPSERLYVATSTFILYTSFIFLFSFLMSFTEKAAFEDILFEVASALGTVGLSRGITGNLTDIGKALIIIIMFVGRVGVLTFGFALLARKRKNNTNHIIDDLAV